MRREALYLADMLEACDDLSEFVEMTSLQDLPLNKLVRSAILQQLMVIGEAAARLPKEFRDKHSDVEWARISSFRNRIVHGYFQVDWSLVWVAATEEVPVLRQRIAEIIAQL
ncbi:MAG: DUF86 domain-containing protein [Armatimonadota bacterium]|nr:DUF86 domain-containing protein [Armatimonadota bacterium]